MARLEARRLQYVKNPFQIIRDGFLSIKTKAGDYVPLQLNPIQEKLLSMIEEDWQAKRPIRYRILKARQEGVSTLVEAVLFVLTAFQKNQNALILADDLKGSNYLFDMSKLYYESAKEKAPAGWLPELEKSNEKGLKFEKTRSQVVIETGDNKEAGRKYTFRIVHISEAAFIPAIGEIMTGLNQSIPDMPGTVLVLETTANGVGGYFYDGWNQAEGEYSLWRNVFFAWFDHPDYSLLFRNSREKQRLLETIGTDQRFNDYDGEEKDLEVKYHCSLEQLNWRRWAIANKCDWSLDKFYQEYPSYPEQAFLVSGRPVFNVKILSKKMMSAPKRPLAVGNLELEPLKPAISAELTFAENSRGYLRIYEHPVKYRRYVIGGDAQKGKIQVESKKEPDFSALHVLDIRTFSQVAVWEGRIDSDLFGLEALKLGRYYNSALVGLELNDGVASVARMKLEGYFNLYRKVTVDRVEDLPTNQLGWWTDVKSKLLMIGDLAKFIRDNLGDINDRATIQQLMTFVYDDEGRTNAQEGCHDDLVTSLAIAYQMTKVLYDTEDPVKKPEDTKGTFEWWEKKLKSLDNKGKTVL